MALCNNVATCSLAKGSIKSLYSPFTSSSCLCKVTATCLHIVRITVNYLDVCRINFQPMTLYIVCDRNGKFVICYKVCQKRRGACSIYRQISFAHFPIFIHEESSASNSISSSNQLAFHFADDSGNLRYLL